MKRNRPTYERKREICPRSPSSRHHIPSAPMTKRNGDFEQPPPISYAPRYGIYNDADGETTMTGHGREGHGWERMGGRAEWKAICTCNTIWLSLFLLNLFSASHHYSNISSPARKSNQKKDAQIRREEERKAVREKRGSHQREQASGKRSSLYPSTRKGDREAFWFAALVQRNEEGEQGQHKPQNPPFLSFIVT